MNPLVVAVPWTVRLRSDPTRVHIATALTAYAAWESAAPHLEYPLFSDVECRLASESAYLVTDQTAAIVEAHRRLTEASEVATAAANAFAAAKTSSEIDRTFAAAVAAKIHLRECAVGYETLTGRAP